MLICKKCGESSAGLLMKGMLVDLGCRVSPSPEVCYDGEDHEFAEQQPEKPIEANGEKSE